MTESIEATTTSSAKSIGENSSTSSPVLGVLSFAGLSGCDCYLSIQPTGRGGPKRALRVVLVQRHWSPSVRRLGLSTGPRSYRVVKWLHMQRSQDGSS